MDNVLLKIREIALKYSNINKVVLFGSRARKDNTPSSDYDIAVFASGSDVSLKNKFTNEIEDIETLNKIDLVWIKQRHKDTELYLNIIKDGIIIMDKFGTKMNNFKNALNRLHEALDESALSESLTVRDGVIQRFEFTTELAWKTLREHLISLGFEEINNPKGVLAEAFNNELITDDLGWLQIVRDRNSTAHIYDEEDASEIYERIANSHIKLFDSLKEKLDNI